MLHVRMRDSVCVHMCVGVYTVCMYVSMRVWSLPESSLLSPQPSCKANKRDILNSQLK